MERPHLIDKPAGATPLQALELFRSMRGLSPSDKLAYAGRLDPLASGLLPILSGAMLHDQESYWYLPKAYDVTAVLGVATDSYDLLGIPSATDAPVPDIERITAVVRGMVGKFDLSVPIFSSRRLGGKPLFTWARSETDFPPDVPVRRMSVSQIDMTGTDDIERDALVALALERVGLVEGDFRQPLIADAWRALPVSGPPLRGVRLTVQCGSGTYLRSIVHEIGRRLRCGAVVAELRRTRVGPWRITDPGVVRLSWPR